MEYGSVGQVNFGYLEAGAVIAMIPCLVLYIALQRYYIRGLTSGWSRGRTRPGVGAPVELAECRQDGFCRSNRHRLRS